MGLPNLENTLVTKLGVAGSEDRLPYVVVDGPLAGDGYVVTAFTQNLTDYTYAVVDSSPIANAAFDISLTGDDIVVTLETTLGVVASSAQISSNDPGTLGKLDLAAINMGVAGNSLTVVLSTAGASDCALSASMGGTGNNVLTVVLGKTGSSVAAAKNTITLIAAAINGITVNKKITATGSGTQSQSRTTALSSQGFSLGVDSVLTAITAADLVDELNDHATWTDLINAVTAALYTGDAESLEAEDPNIGDADVAEFPATAFSNPSLTGSGVDTRGYREALVILTIGTISPAGALDVKIQDSADNITFDDVEGAVFETKTDLDSGTVDSARLRLDGTTVRRYIKAVSVLDPDDQIEFAEHSVVFVLGGGQYVPQTVTPVAFAV